MREWVYEVALQHVENRRVSPAAIKAGCEALRNTKEDQLFHEFKLQIIAGDEPEPPAAVSHLDKQCVL